MVLALYRRYRPDTLLTVIGQEHVTEPLARAIDSGKVHHAFLFSGPRGCGKTSICRYLIPSVGLFVLNKDLKNSSAI
jgi:DNA polymerase-3 subunit gamma/tau